MMATLLTSILLVVAGGQPTYQNIELTEDESRSLREAPSSMMNNPPSEYLQAALNEDEVRAIVAKAVPGQVIARVTYAQFSISATRIYKPEVLCAADKQGAWIHCQDESSIVVRLGGFQPLTVSESIDDQELTSILEFVDASELLSSGMKAIHSSDVYGVNTLGNGIAVHLKINEETPSVYLRRKNNSFEIWGGSQCHGLERPEFIKQEVEAKPNKLLNSVSTDKIIDPPYRTKLLTHPVS